MEVRSPWWEEGLEGQKNILRAHLIPVFENTENINFMFSEFSSVFCVHVFSEKKKQKRNQTCSPCISEQKKKKKKTVFKSCNQTGS